MTEDVRNDQFVSVRGDHIVVLRRKSMMSKREALVLAAWLVALADDNDQFPAILEAVKAT